MELLITEGDTFLCFIEQKELLPFISLFFRFKKIPIKCYLFHIITTISKLERAPMKRINRLLYTTQGALQVPEFLDSVY